MTPDGELTLWPQLAEPRARRTDPGTSHQAARSVRNVTEVQLAILTILDAYTESTDVGIQEIYKDRMFHRNWPPVSDSGLRTRRRELTDRGFVRDSGLRHELNSGRKAIVWEITDKGREERGRAEADA